MFADIPAPLKDRKFCDPCCGGGNFIMAAIRHGFSPENISGYDTDPTAIEIAKRRIFQETGYESKNIYRADFLEVLSDKNALEHKFDAILTRPRGAESFKSQKK